MLKIINRNINFNRNICVHLYENEIWFQFGEGPNCSFFTKIETKSRQKYKYKNQIENKGVTPDIIVTHATVTVTSHH